MTGAYRAGSTLQFHTTQADVGRSRYGTRYLAIYSGCFLYLFFFFPPFSFVLTTPHFQRLKHTAFFQYRHSYYHTEYRVRQPNYAALPVPSYIYFAEFWLLFLTLD